MKIRLSLKQKIGLGGFLLLTAAQFFLLHEVDSFLQSPSFSAIEAAKQQAGTTPDIKPEESISVPADAVKYALSADKQHVAYTTNQDELIVLGKDGAKSYSTVGPVTYIQWLGSSDSVLYFVQGTYLDANILQLNAAKPLLINEWWGKQRQIVNTYFSPYMELLYIELQNGSYTEIYKYDAVTGLHQLPLPNLRITHVDYDELADVMKLTDSSGQLWKYQNGRLYRPDGSAVYQSAPSSTGTQSSSGSSAGDRAGASSNPTSKPKSVPGSTNSAQAGSGSSSGSEQTNSVSGSTEGSGSVEPASSSNSTSSQPPASSSNSTSAHPPVSSPPQNSGNSVKSSPLSGSTNGPVR